MRSSIGHIALVPLPAGYIGTFLAGTTPSPDRPHGKPYDRLSDAFVVPQLASLQVRRRRIAGTQARFELRARSATAAFRRAVTAAAGAAASGFPRPRRLSRPLRGRRSQRRASRSSPMLPTPRFALRSASRWQFLTLNSERESSSRPCKRRVVARLTRMTATISGTSDALAMASASSYATLESSRLPSARQSSAVVLSTLAARRALERRAISSASPRWRRAALTSLRSRQMFASVVSARVFTPSSPIDRLSTTLAWHTPRPRRVVRRSAWSCAAAASTVPAVRD